MMCRPPTNDVDRPSTNYVMPPNRAIHTRFEFVLTPWMQSGYGDHFLRFISVIITLRIVLQYVSNEYDTTTRHIFLMQAAYGKVSMSD